jgi:hypothetical protein
VLNLNVGSQSGADIHSAVVLGRYRPLVSFSNVAFAHHQF